MKSSAFRYIALPALLFVILSGSPCKIVDIQNETKIESTIADSIVLVFAGDVMGHVPQLEAAYDKQSGKYDFTSCYQFITPYVASADFAVANLEVPLAGKPYSGYPCFSSPEALLDGALSAGFDVIQLANNHVVDRGKIGIERTYAAVNKKVPSVGVYPCKSLRDSLYPLIMNVKGIRLAILNCTFDTNGHAVPLPCVVNGIDTAQIRQDIVTARKRGAQCVIMTIHWGVEYELNANENQKKLARFMAKAGVDIIIGSHPHVVQNFEWIAKNDSCSIPVFYSLGNMISNQRWRNSNGGILARITLSRSSGNVLKVSYLPFYVHKGTLEGKLQYYLLPTERYRSRYYSFHLAEKEDSMLVTFDQDTRLRLNKIERWK
jgi:poly-gamma-glutamate capsule biosynthesis protein CapA/YwtB (metallophosphatase superfamily)